MATILNLKTSIFELLHYLKECNLSRQENLNACMWFWLYLKAIRKLPSQSNHSSYKATSITIEQIPAYTKLMPCF